jgi:aminomethyltransferase
MLKRTPLYSSHLLAKAKMVDFAGWEMPIHYGSQLEEHRSVRQAAGVFDVSHMTIVDINGREATPYLSHLLANDVSRTGYTGELGCEIILPADKVENY